MSAPQKDCNYMSTDFEVVVGLEVHCQLLTKSKMFCSCSSKYQSAPANSLVCPVCLGMPGILPVINKLAIRHVILTGLALGCEIRSSSKFDRKNYPYPDLMKGYQISQYDEPIAHNGALVIKTIQGKQKTVRITRVHLEEDVAKLIHRSETPGDSYSLLDINRSGVPLMEIVSEPDISNAEEARHYLTNLHGILRYLGVSTGNMEDGSFRCDANISVKPRDATSLGSKVEIKNMNSFRSVFRAIQFEAQRQIKAIGKKDKIEQETRGWNEYKEATFSQRSKEYASDYRYFPEPDLPPLQISREYVDAIKAEVPELPTERKRRFESEYQLSDYDSALLTMTKEQADYFENTIKLSPLKGTAKHKLAKTMSNWMLGEMTKLNKLHNNDISDLKIEPHHMLQLIALTDTGQLSNTMAKTVFEEMFNTGKAPSDITKVTGDTQISDPAPISAAIDRVVRANPRPVSDYMEGKETAIKFLIGQVMKMTLGKANPQLVHRLMQEKLENIK